MNRIIVILAFFCLTTTAALAQAGYGGQEQNLRALKGVRLTVMFVRADALNDNDKPAILKSVEADAIASLQKAGISILRSASEIEQAGFPQLMVYITCERPNGFVYPVVVNVKLLQRVRLTRDPSIEANLATWEHSGVGAPKPTVETIHKVTATELDEFIKDYIAVNR